MGKSLEQFWVCIEEPEATLGDVARSMSNKGGYWDNLELRTKYSAKVCSVLRLLAKSLRYLHSRGAVHGDLSLESCGKFHNGWKLRGVLQLQQIGKPFDASRFQRAFPPEALYSPEEGSTIFDSDAPPVAFRESIIAAPSIDIWSFGKLAYEAIMGKELVSFEKTKPSDDAITMVEVMEWDEGCMKKIFFELCEVGGITENGAELIASCLFPRPEDRPTDMEEILRHSFWRENQKRRVKSRGDRRRRHTDSFSAFTDTSLFTD